MAKKGQEKEFTVRVLFPRIHKPEPYRVGFGISSASLWALHFDNPKLADDLAAKVKRTSCDKRCPVINECSGPQVIRRKHHHLQLTVEASSLHNIFTRSSGAQCMKKGTTQ